MLDDLRDRGVKFRSLTEAIDTETPTGRAMWQMIGVLAELEKSLISERTRAGVKDAKRRGVKFGRKPKLTAQQIGHARTLINQGETPQSVASLLRVSRATVYRTLTPKGMERCDYRNATELREGILSRQVIAPLALQTPPPKRTFSPNRLNVSRSGDSLVRSPTLSLPAQNVSLS